MRLGFLALHQPDSSPSQRYRVEAFLPALQQAGIECDYAWVLDREDLRIFYGSAPAYRKGLVAARALARRVASLTRLRRWDVVLVQREAFFLLGAWSEWLAAKAAPLVFDFDDAIWMHAVSPGNRRFAFLKNVDKVAELVRMSHTVIAGNRYLADWARQYRPQVELVPTCVDTRVFRPAPAGRSEQAPVTIGWSGSPSTVAHLRTIVPALTALKSRYGERISLRAMGDPSLQVPELGLRGEAWSPSAELAFLQSLDIGLMPLPDDEWTRGKCGLKGLVSMASGAATVMSPVGVNTEIVTDHVDGLLASTQAEWERALSELVEEGALRRRLAQAGRETVEARYSVERWAPKLIELVTAAAG